MKNDDVMARLRAARPAPSPPPEDHDARFAQTIAEPGDPRLADPATVKKVSRSPRWTTRPRILAGGSLGLAAIVAGLVLAFSGSTAPPAFAITRNADGSVLVHLYGLSWLHGSAMEAADHELNADGIAGYLYVGTWHGPAPVPGPISCDGLIHHRDAGGPAVLPAGAHASDPSQVKMELGRDNTYVTPDGRSWHLVMCMVDPPKSAEITTTTDTGPNITTGGPTDTTGQTMTNGAG